MLRTVFNRGLAAPLASLAGTPSMLWAQASPDDLIAYERRVEGGDAEIRVMGSLETGSDYLGTDAAIRGHPMG